MEFRNVLATLSIMVSGLAALAAPPNAKEPPNARPPATAERQPAGTNQGDTTQTNGQQSTAWRNGDHFLASCVAIDNQEEIAVAQWAEQKLQNKDVKEFARMLVKDHSDFLAKLQQHAPEATRENFLTSVNANQQPAGQRGEDGATRNRNEASDRDGVREPTQPTPQPKTVPQRNAVTQPNTTDGTNGTDKRIAGTQHSNQNGNLNVDLMQLHREIADQCLADTKEMLSQKSDKEMDACFIGLQIAKHAAMKTKLEVFQRHASGELKELLAQGESATSNHLEQAEKLMKQLEDASTRTAGK